jgi:hypothetical protein
MAVLFDVFGFNNARHSVTKFDFIVAHGWHPRSAPPASFSMEIPPLMTWPKTLKATPSAGKPTIVLDVFDCPLME